MAPILVQVCPPSVLTAGRLKGQASGTETLPALLTLKLMVRPTPPRTRKEYQRAKVALVSWRIRMLTTLEETWVQLSRDAPSKSVTSWMSSAGSGPGPVEESQPASIPPMTRKNNGPLRARESPNHAERTWLFERIDGSTPIAGKPPGPTSSAPIRNDPFLPICNVSAPYPGSKDVEGATVPFQATDGKGVVIS